LEEQLSQTEWLLSYKILPFPNILVIKVEELPREVIIHLNKILGMSYAIERFGKIGLYSDAERNFRLMTIYEEILEYLQLKPKNLLGYGILTITNSGKMREGELKFLLINSDFKRELLVSSNSPYRE